MLGKKFISPLSPLQVEWLWAIEQSPLESGLTRKRTRAIRLSHLGYAIDDLVQICGATRKTVSGWLDRWQRNGFDALIESPRPGRPLIIQESEHEEVIAIVKENPRQIKSALKKIEEKFGRTISPKTLKRIIKKNFVGGERGSH